MRPSSRTTRREAITVGAAVGAAALVAGPFSPNAIAKRRTPKCASLKDIEHIVVLMQENRSFDQYFGLFPGVRGFSDRLNRQAFSQPGYTGTGAQSGKLLPFQVDGTLPVGQCLFDPTHDWLPQHQSWNRGKNNQFFASHAAPEFDGPAAPGVMGFYGPKDIPFWWGLAKAFTLCDGYHCSVLGPTEPNRLYSISAWLDPSGTNGGPSVATKFNAAGLVGDFSWPTMPQALSAHGVSWKSYTAPAGQPDSPFPAFSAFRDDPALNALGVAPVYPDDFVADMDAGRLPSVSWIQLAFTDSEHPSFPPASGEHATNGVLQSIFARPEIWRKTAIVVNYDENGGFFDHVPPPTPPRGTPGEFLTVPDLPPEAQGDRGPIGLGFRVPCTVVSPWSRGGLICSDTFDHTSVLRLIETRFGVRVPNLTRWRRSVTGDLTSAFNFAAKPDFSVPRLPATSADPPSTMDGACIEFPPPPYPVPASIRMPRQMPVRGSVKRPSGVC